MRSHRLLALFTAAILLAAAGPSARAQDVAPPKFEFDKPPEKETDWRVQAKGGLIVTTGNSQSRNGVLSLSGSRQRGGNKISLDGQAAYGRSNIIVPVVGPDPTDATRMAVTGLDRRGETTANEWRARGRYDRFLTDNNAIYGLGQIGADRIAGKRLVGGGQVGYSRQLLNTETQTLVAELGYDFSYESYVAQPGRTIDPVSIHSARVLAGHRMAINPQTGLNVSGEALFNLNEEQVLNANDPTRMVVPAFRDTRLIGRANLTTTLRKNLSFGFGFTVRYDQNPAPRPLPGAAGGVPFAPGFVPFANKVDTLTEATLVFTFL
jgi:hypothetical protein